uniref:Ovule protein n=1 Tax=Caenorhabditis tropicalis TaxID=1561998 RepID=A0A1I7UYA3_9PELO
MFSLVEARVSYGNLTYSLNTVVVRTVLIISSFIQFLPEYFPKLLMSKTEETKCTSLRFRRSFSKVARM